MISVKKRKDQKPASASGPFFGLVSMVMGGGDIDSFIRVFVDVSPRYCIKVYLGIASSNRNFFENFFSMYFVVTFYRAGSPWIAAPPLAARNDKIEGVSAWRLAMTRLRGLLLGGRTQFTPMAGPEDIAGLAHGRAQFAPAEGVAGCHSTVRSVRGNVKIGALALT